GAAIRRVAEGVQQQRDVVVGVVGCDVEDDGHFRVERRLVVRGEVACGREGQSKAAGVDALYGHQFGASAVGVRDAGGDRVPVLAVGAFEHDGDSGGSAADGGIEDVGGDSAHTFNHFLNRRLVMRSCCRAAS